MNAIISALCPALSVFVLLTAITGVAYPLAVTGIAQLAFPHAANGSVIEVGGKAVGSSLIGQSFSSPQYFWGRPSATSPMPNNGLASSGSNLGANNPALRAAVKARVDALRAADPGNAAPVPVDLVTTSASGLDPEISVAGAIYQAPRIAKLRHVALEQVLMLIDANTLHAWIGVVGEPRVNVLALNLALDGKVAQPAR